MLVMAVKTYWLSIALTDAATLPSCYEVTVFFFEIFEIKS